jgi:hypothetical protein
VAGGPHLSSEPILIFGPCYGHSLGFAEITLLNGNSATSSPTIRTWSKLPCMKLVPNSSLGRSILTSTVIAFLVGFAIAPICVAASTKNDSPPIMPDDRVAIYRAVLTGYFCSVSPCDNKFPKKERRSYYLLDVTSLDIPVQFPSDIPSAPACMKNVPFESKMEINQHRFPSALVQGTQFRMATKKQVADLKRKCHMDIVEFGEISFDVNHRFAMLRFFDGHASHNVVLEWKGKEWQADNERSAQCEGSVTVDDYACQR